MPQNFSSKRNFSTEITCLTFNLLTQLLRINLKNPRGYKVKDEDMSSLSIVLGPKSESLTQ